MEAVKNRDELTKRIYIAIINQKLNERFFLTSVKIL